MAYCFSEDCGDYAVTPMLVSPCGPVKCCESAPMCYPCLPRCPKGQVVYCCDKRPCGKSRREEREEEDCCSLKHRAPPEPAPQYCCPTCNQPTCKPVKTKYVIPCYRYEDGRIINQPTLLMRRACEVAVGTRPRRRPFVVSSFCADPDRQVHRYHAEDEQGNCCYHFEKKNQECDFCHACESCQSCPVARDRVYARTIEPKCCYYCC
ncbi:uncharacterized protein [Epargyreus clarus]|uniref:uncharacterized protein isoform X1 n=1 Tax=Epargyreus clarus TaxID=520877 RepID=UPI003C2E8299